MFKVSNCFKCDLAVFRNHIVNGIGNDKANIMFVLNNPSKSDNDSGNILSNRTGILFDYILEHLNIKDDVYITYLTKCKPPGLRNPTDEETHNCKPNILEEFKEVKPRVVILCGQHVIKSFFNTGLSINLIHGNFKIIGNTLYCVTYDLTILNKDIDLRKLLILDLIKFIQVYQQLNPSHQFDNINKLYSI